MSALIRDVWLAEDTRLAGTRGLVCCEEVQEQQRRRSRNNKDRIVEEEALVSANGNPM